MIRYMKTSSLPDEFFFPEGDIPPGRRAHSIITTGDCTIFSGVFTITTENYKNTIENLEMEAPVIIFV